MIPQTLTKYEKDLPKKVKIGPKKEKAQRRAILSPLGDTFATAVLNFCVRDGNRCVHRAIATRLFLERGYAL